MSRRARRGCLILTLTLALHACALQPQPKQPAIAASPSQVSVLLARDATLDSLQTAAVMAYQGPGGRFKAREQIAVRRPASLRVEALSPLGVALIVTADRGQLAIFDPGKNTLTRGVADPETLSQVARIPLAPEQTVRLLLGLPPDPGMLSGSPNAIEMESGMSILRFARADVIEELGFNGNNLAMVRRKSPNGALIYDIRYSDYNDIGSLIFPHTITANFATTATSVTLNYVRPLVDGAIPDSTFVLLPGPQTRELRLGAAAARSIAS